MIVTVASFKGGVGKTTTSVHLAKFLNEDAPTLLLDGDQTRNATAWASRGPGFGFEVAPVEAGTMRGRNFRHVVIDTGQRMSDEDMRYAAEGCDLLVIPTVVSALDTDGLGQTIRAVQAIKKSNGGGAKFKVLLTRVPPDAAKDALELRELLQAMKAPVFAAEIPRLKAFDKAADAGLVVGAVDDKNAARAWAAYCEVGKELRS